MLWCGVIAGPLFIVVFLINDRIRDDYDPVRDFVSEAAIGPGGWVQIANFLVCATLLMVFAVGVARRISPWTGRLIGLFAAGLFAAGVFVADAVPGPRTWHGRAHDAVSAVVFVSLTAAAVVAARRFTGVWRWYSAAVAVAVPTLFVLAGGVPAATGVFQRLSIAAGWTWLAALGRKLSRGR